MNSPQPSLPASWLLPEEVIAATVNSLPSRLARRAAVLKEKRHQWEVLSEGEGTFRIAVESCIVRWDGKQLHCTCLLSPRCAHCGAVALAAVPVRAVGDAPLQAEGSPTDKRLLAPKAKVEAAVAEASQALEQVVDCGLLGLDPLGYSRLRAVHTRCRGASLPRLARALSSLCTSYERVRQGQDIDWHEASASLIEALLVVRLLSRNPCDDEAIGHSKQRYQPLTPGRDDGVFVPLYAIPNLRPTGEAEVRVVLASPEGKHLYFTRTQRGDRDAVEKLWHGPVNLGGIHASVRDVCEHQVIISGGASTPEGRLQLGTSSRAVLGRPVEFNEVARIVDASPAIELINGTVTYADLACVVIDGKRLRFSSGARVLGTAGVVKQLLEAPKVAVLIRDDTVLSVWILDAETPPRRLFPGIGLNHDTSIVVSPLHELGAETLTVPDITQRWIRRATMLGSSGVTRHPLGPDLRLLEQLQAPTAAQLIHALHASYCPERLLALGVYSATFGATVNDSSRDSVPR